MENFEFKIVVAGAFGVGKTTMISSVSNVDVVGTEVPTRGDEAAFKDSTTVGLEYGTFEVSSGGFDLSLLVYGTPGQERFRYMWQIVAIGADACVILVDATDTSTWHRARALADFFNDEERLPIVIGANRSDGDEDVLTSIRLHTRIPVGTPVIPCDVTDSASARNLVVAAFEQILEPMSSNGKHTHA